MKSSSALLFAVAAFVGSLAGCDSSEPKSHMPPVPVGSSGGDEEKPAKAAVYLKGRVEGERVVVDVVARGAADIHGAAFRLHWDASKISFVEARGSDAWSRQALLLAKEGLPGELAIAWTEKGTGAAVDAREDTRLGSISFIAKAHDGAALAFRTDRSMLVDTKGTPISVEWRGGHVGAR